MTIVRTFACLTDLVHWTKFTGTPLIAPAEPWAARDEPSP